MAGLVETESTKYSIGDHIFIKGTNEMNVQTAEIVCFKDPTTVTCEIMIGDFPQSTITIPTSSIIRLNASKPNSKAKTTQRYKIGDHVFIEGTNEMNEDEAEIVTFNDDNTILVEIMVGCLKQGPRTICAEEIFRLDSEALVHRKNSVHHVHKHIEEERVEKKMSPKNVVRRIRKSLTTTVKTLVSEFHSNNINNLCLLTQIQSYTYTHTHTIPNNSFHHRTKQIKIKSFYLYHIFNKHAMITLNPAAVNAPTPNLPPPLHKLPSPAFSAL